MRVEIDAGFSDLMLPAKMESGEASASRQELAVDLTPVSSGSLALVDPMFNEEDAFSSSLIQIFLAHG